MSENNEENESIMAKDAVGPSGSQGEVTNTVSGKAYPQRYHSPEKDEETTGVAEALDGGWGWCVVLGTTTCMMILATQGPCLGILYGNRLRDLGASPTLIAWLMNFQALAWNFAGPWAGPLSGRFSYRAVAVTAAMMSVSSLFLSAFVTTPYLMLLTFSILSGVGGGININCCYQLTAQYFDKRLGAANGIMVAGGSVGLLLLPLLASHLQELYPFQWATLITGALMLHAVVGSLLFHPLNWHLKRPKNCDQLMVAATSHNTDETQTYIPLHKVDFSLKAEPSRLPRGCSVPQELLTLTSDPQNDEKPNMAASSWYCSTNLSSTDPVGVDHDDTMQVLPLQRGGKNGEECVGLWAKFRAQYNMAVLRDPMVVIIALATCLTVTAAINIFATIPFVLSDAGFSLKEAARAMSVAAVVDLVTRLLAATIMDLPQFSPRVLYAVGQLVFVVVPFVLVSSLNRWWMVMACMAAFGMGLAILYVMDVLLIVRLLGVHKFQSVFGISQLFRCVAFIVLGPAGGALEATGGYVSTLAFFSCTELFAFILMIAATTFCARPASSR